MVGGNVAVAAGRRHGQALLRRAGNAAGHGGRASAEDLIGRLATAAERGPLVLFAEASVAIRTFLGVADVRIVIRSGGCWHGWDQLDATDESTPGEALPEAAAHWTGATPIDGGLFVAVRPGSVALILPHHDGTAEDGAADGGAAAGGAADGGTAALDADALGTACAALRLATGACDRPGHGADRLDAIAAFQRVAHRILTSRDLQEILLLITHETKSRLGADICGVMLLDEDRLVMQRCVGNLSARTANLSMRAGQGVAGRVLERLEPCCVEDYLRSDIISADFYDLARIERVRSALAAPLVSQGGVLGVLEVWRRRPSVFTPQHSAELVALASLASIAIENARLHEARERDLIRLAAANRALQDRCDLTSRTVALQADLTQMLLEGKALGGIAEQAAQHLERPCLFLDERLRLEAASDDAPPWSDLQPHVRAAIGQYRRTDAQPVTQPCGERMLLLQPIMAGRDRFGWIVFIDADATSESLRPLLVQVGNVAALHHVKRRAAARARADRLETVLWDLLDAPGPTRRIAVERADDLGVKLDGAHRVLCCVVHGLAPAEDPTVSAAERDQAARLAAEAVAQAADHGAMARLSGMRGETLAVVCRDTPPDALRRHAAALARLLTEALPTRRISLGVSAPAADPMTLAGAWREARIAATVARQRDRAGVVFHADVGVTGLLMGARDETDFRTFVGGTLGAVLRQHGPQRGVLLKTVRTFFDANCSRQHTARLLRVHQKTVCYRLDKFASLTGLDLARHEDRLLIDLALRMHEIGGQEGPDPTGPDATGPDAAPPS